MKKKYVHALGLWMGLAIANHGIAQNVGVNATGATPNASTILDLNTGNTFTSPNGKGLLIPNVALTGTGDATTVTSPATSLMVYNTATAGAGATAVTPGYYYWDGTKWVQFQSSSNASQDWKLTGNAGTTAGTNFIGTTDAVDFVTKTNNAERMRVTSAGKVGIGTSAPTASLHISGTNANAGSGTPLFRVTDVPSSNYLAVDNGHNFSNFRLISTDTLQLQSGGVPQITLARSGGVGIGTTNPSTSIMLEVNKGTATSAIKIVDGTEGVNKVLTSDANGVGTWSYNSIRAVRVAATGIRNPAGIDTFVTGSVLVYTIEQKDDDNAYNNVTGVFTAPRNGYYTFEVATYLNYTNPAAFVNSNGNVDLVWSGSGTTYALGRVWEIPSDNVGRFNLKQGTNTVYLTAGQTIKPVFNSNAGGTVTNDYLTSPWYRNTWGLNHIFITY